MLTMADLDKLVEEIKGLTLVEASELVKRLEEELGVSAAAAPVAMAAMPGMAGAPAAAAEEVEEKTEFDVVLKEVGPKKIPVIKVVRQLSPSLGLKEAKAVVDGAPGPVLENVSKEVAEDAKAKLEAEGAVVEIA
jgi:large subunit ribosomal protein L7/L12